jgi:hypothetical protein
MSLDLTPATDVVAALRARFGAAILGHPRPRISP